MSHKDKNNGITRSDAEQAVATLIQWAGDDPKREGLKNTPKRVVSAYEEFFAGYQQNASDLMTTTFSETENYTEMILLKDIRFESHCEHHLVPIIGKAHIAYIPNKNVVGISKLARLVEIYSKRLQLQERMTMQISNMINERLEPAGVAIALISNHHCISIRGIHKHDSNMVTLNFTGDFKQTTRREEFLRLIKAT